MSKAGYVLRGKHTGSAGIIPVRTGGNARAMGRSSPTVRRGIHAAGVKYLSPA